MKSANDAFMKKDCVFCRIVKGIEPSWTVYEDDLIKAFLDINPASEGHTLIILKEHYETIYTIPERELKRIIVVAKKLAKVYRMALSEEISHLKILCNNKKVSWLLEKISDDIEAICKVKKVSFSKKGSMDEKFEFQGCKIGLQFEI